MTNANLLCGFNFCVLEHSGRYSGLSLVSFTHFLGPPSRPLAPQWDGFRSQGDNFVEQANGQADGMLASVVLLIHRARTGQQLTITAVIGEQMECSAFQKVWP